VERWLKAPLQREDGSLVWRDRGTPQGSAISPLLVNVRVQGSAGESPGLRAVSGSGGEW
jgi:retron-type reverse transcriptase